MLQVPLLETKVYVPPVRPRLVSRPRLIERLHAGLHRSLTLISAPAGFGKTTLVSEWVADIGAGTGQADLPLQVAWLSLDEGDNDPARFLAYLIAALQKAEARQEPSAQQERVSPIGHGIMGALQSPQPPPAEDVLTVLLNDIAALPARILLVLDDYHLIEAQEIHDALAFLVDHLPPQMHLVIATREDPHLSLARLRARGQLTELRAADLRFTASEAAEFLNQAMGLDLSAGNIAALETRTEGWIAGLQLAALALQGTAAAPGRGDADRLIASFSGSHRYVLDYLLEEVLQQQPPSIQDFLLRTSILDRLCGPLCATVRFDSGEAPSSPGKAAVRFDFSPTPSSPGGASVPFAAGQDSDRFAGADARVPNPSASGQEILDYLEHTNLFIIPLDQERRWYRYHHLFSDLLRQRLRQMHPQRVPMLHRRASEWYEQNGFSDVAIEHALRAGDFERAAHLIEGQIDAAWQRGEHTKLRRWLEGLPAEYVFSRPNLCVFYAWHMIARGQRDLAEPSLQAAENALGAGVEHSAGSRPIERTQTAHPDRKKLQGRIAVLRAQLAFFRGDMPGIIQYSRHALDHLPEQDSAWRSSAAIALGDALRIQGDVQATYRARLEALAISKAQGNVYSILIASMKLAVTMRQLGRLARVAQICEHQLHQASECGLAKTAAAGGFLAIWGEVLAELGDLAGALEKAETGVDLAACGEDMMVLGWSYLCLMRVLLSRGDLAAAEELLQRVENSGRNSRIPPWINKMMATWQARLWLAQDRLEDATRWMAERELDVDGDLRFLRELEQIVLARILMAQGQWDRAASLLQRLLGAAETAGHLSTQIEILILQALARQARGDGAQALTRLERALTLAGPGGFLRIFVDEGSPMARLLDRLREKGVALDDVTRLLGAFETTGDVRWTDDRQRLVADREQSQSPAFLRQPSPLIEPLSQRELEVLQLIAEGLTNREIAAKLFLSLNTVKAHTRNIYGKLDVHSRTRAVARAQAQGLIERDPA